MAVHGPQGDHCTVGKNVFLGPVEMIRWTLCMPSNVHGTCRAAQADFTNMSCPSDLHANIGRRIPLNGSTPISQKGSMESNGPRGSWGPAGQDGPYSRPAGSSGQPAERPAGQQWPGDRQHDPELDLDIM